MENTPNTLFLVGTKHHAPLWRRLIPISKRLEFNELSQAIKSLERSGILYNLDLRRTEMAFINCRIHYFRASAKLNFSSFGYPKVTASVLGCGESTRPQQAAIIALSELIERISPYAHNTFYRKGDLTINSSNGIAFHYSAFRAYTSAYTEAIERDSFLAHWYTQCRGKRLPDDSKMQSWIHRTSKGAFTFKEYELESGDKRYKAVCCLAVRQNFIDGLFNLFFGIGCGTTRTLAQAKARSEMNRFLNLYLFQNNSQSIETSGCLPGISPEVDRFLEYQKPSNQHAFDFLEYSSPPCDPAVGSPVPGEYQILPVPSTIAGRYFAVRFSSRHLQDLDYFVKPNLNLTRLSRFGGKVPPKINPHPIP